MTGHEIVHSRGFVPNADNHSIKRWALALLLALPMRAAARLPLERRARRRQQHQSKLYIVQMIDAPVAATPEVRGLKATKPARGQKINPLSNDVVRYEGLPDRET